MWPAALGPKGDLGETKVKGETKVNHQLKVNCPPKVKSSDDFGIIAVSSLSGLLKSEVLRGDWLHVGFAPYCIYSCMPILRVNNSSPCLPFMRHEYCRGVCYGERPYTHITQRMMQASQNHRSECESGQVNGYICRSLKSNYTMFAESHTVREQGLRISSWIRVVLFHFTSVRSRPARTRV